MNLHLQATLLGIGIPISILFWGSVVTFSKRMVISSLLQLIGAGGLMIVVLAHVAEAFRLFSSMGWGMEHSPGHYLNLTSAVLGLALFPLGYLIQALRLPS